jgi:hypothetical protein
VVAGVNGTSFVAIRNCGHSRRHNQQMERHRTTHRFQGHDVRDSQEHKNLHQWHGRALQPRSGARTQSSSIRIDGCDCEKSMGGRRQRRIPNRSHRHHPPALQIRRASTRIPNRRRIPGNPRWLPSTRVSRCSNPPEAPIFTSQKGMLGQEVCDRRVCCRPPHPPTSSPANLGGRVVGGGCFKEGRPEH